MAIIFHLPLLILLSFSFFIIFLKSTHCLSLNKFKMYMSTLKGKSVLSNINRK